MRIDRVAFAAALARRDINQKRLAGLCGAGRVAITPVKSGKTWSGDTARKLAAVLGPEIMEKED